MTYLDYYNIHDIINSTEFDIIYNEDNILLIQEIFYKLCTFLPLHYSNKLEEGIKVKILATIGK